MVIQLATLEAAKSFFDVFANAIEDPDTYKRIEAVRQFVSQVTGVEIDKGAFITLLETTTQGESYTGDWEQIDDDTRRLRVANGYIYDSVSAHNIIFVAD